jgi:hypothetical protein
MKIFELLIDEDDELSGVQFISIVKNPANEVRFEVFNDQTPHSCQVEEDLPVELLKHFEEFGEELNPDLLMGAKIKPATIVLTPEDFAAPSIDTDPRKFDIWSGDQEGGNVITRYIYGVDTGMGAPLIRTSREMCRKMLAAQRVFSRQDIINLSNKLTSAGDTFKLVPRAKMNSQVDAFEYKMGALCRHRWFQIEFPVPDGMSYEDALKTIPLKAQAALGVGKNVGGAGRPFQAEAKIVPPSQLNRRPAGFSAEEDLDAINFHMGLFMYKSRKAALLAEPEAKAITKVKIKACGYDYGCAGYMPIEVYPEYFEGSAEVLETFKVRQNFVKVPEYIREVAKRAVDYAQENGWGSCGTEVGKRRANDLADAEYNASLDILTRMYSYGSRHKQDWESSDGFDDGCGDLMMAAWGLSRSNYDEAMKWLETQIDRATQDNVAFSKDEFKGDITAVVFQPEQKIYRYDPNTQTPYYVFMSRDTIRKMLMKVSRLKPKNLINFEHTDKVFSGDEVYSYENWLVGDDPRMDKSYEIFGREFAPGTWITTIHFRNQELFDNFILSNETAGVSLEGLFEEVPFNFMKFKSAADTTGMVNYLDPDGEDLLKKEVEMEFPEDTCWEGYEPYGTKILNGREVPNCVPIKTSKIQMAMELDVFGYNTEYFFVCPGARELFQHLIEMNPPVEEQGMIRSLALQADAVFQIEYEAMKRGSATSQELQQAILLVDDFMDLLEEVDKLLGMEHDASFMLGHIDAIASLTENFAPYPWDECIADMTARYGAEAAPKICGKIRSENMNKTEMSKEDFDAAIQVFLLEELIKKMDR